MKLDRGYLHAKKIGGAEAFGFYERTPSLPQAAKEDPGPSFIPSSMDGAKRNLPLPRFPPRRHMALQPREELPVPEPRILRLQDPVVLVGEEDEARGHALGFQRVVV